QERDGSGGDGEQGSGAVRGLLHGVFDEKHRWSSGWRGCGHELADKRTMTKVCLFGKHRPERACGRGDMGSARIRRMRSQEAGGLHHSVLSRIGEDLVHDRVRAGDVLSMEQLEERYGVSRTVVREVVKVLESIGVATSRRRVGVTFRPAHRWEALSPVVIRWRLEAPRRMDQLGEVSELRRGIEPQAARLAAERASASDATLLLEAAEGMARTGPEGDLHAYLRHDIDFHRVLLSSSGNALLASFAPFVAE